MYNRTLMTGSGPCTQGLYSSFGVGSRSGRVEFELDAPQPGTGDSRLTISAL